MAQVKRRYTTMDGVDWIVTAEYDEPALDKAHWFEAKVEATEEKTGRKYPFPREIRTYRIGEIEHSFRQYVDIDWDGDREVTWTLVEGNMLRMLDGAYTLVDRGDGTTEVTYRLALDVSIPLIGMLKRKGEKILIDTALKGLKKRVESLA